MNKWIVTGNLTRDPEKGTTQTGVNWCRFTLAVRKRTHREGEPDSDFIRVTAWRGLGDTYAGYLKKGRKVMAVGTPSVSAWTDQRDGRPCAAMEMTAEEVEFLSPKKDGDPAAEDAAD